MSSAIAYLRLHKSGATGDNHGGVIHADEVLSQTGTGIVNITGVTFYDGYGNPAGNGTLTYTAAAHSLKWAPSGGTAGEEVVVTGDGRYQLYDAVGDKSVVLNCVDLSMPATDQTDTVTIAVIEPNAFRDILALESYNGITLYACLYLKNSWTGTLNQVKVWIDPDTTGDASMMAGLDPAGNGDGSTTGIATIIASETTAPTGVTFGTPSSKATALNIGTLTTGQCRACWFKFTLPGAERLAAHLLTGLRFAALPE